MQHISPEGPQCLWVVSSLKPEDDLSVAQPALCVREDVQPPCRGLGVGAGEVVPTVGCGEEGLKLKMG